MRRTAIAVMGVLLLLGTGTAGAQTTTSSTTTSSSTTSTSTSTSTTAPAAPSPRGIPTATLIAASGRVTGELGSYCWEAAPPSVAMCRHVDYVLEGPNPGQTLTVIQGETVTLRYDPAMAVESVATTVWNAPPGSANVAVSASNPAQFPIDLPVGTRVVTFTVRFAGMSSYYVSYEFKLQVQARATTTTVPPARPAQPTRGSRVFLTG